MIKFKFYFQSKVNVMNAYRVEKIIQKVRTSNTSSNYEFLNANRLFVSNKLQVRDCMQNLFQNEIVPTDFVTDPKAALDTINGWVAKQTKNQIKDLLSADNINGATQLVLVRNILK